jgi:alcohol dehydrogenase (cytochrome c)
MRTRTPTPPTKTLISVLGWTILLSCACADDWPQWQGPSRNAVSKEAGLLKEWPKDGPPLAWRITGIGGGDSAPAVAAGRIYGLANRGEDEVVWALSETDGKTVWVSRLGPAFKQRPSQGKEGPSGTPTVDGERLYVEGLAGDVSCLQASDGKILWQRSLVRDFGGRAPMWSYRESPLVDGEKVICTPGAQDAMLAALDKLTGKTLWKSAVPASPTGETSGPGGPGGQGGPGGGGGGRGNAGGFGIAAGVAPQMFAQADANKDQKLSRAEFTALADAWFDRLDPEKTGKVTGEQFAERFYDAVPREQNTSAPDAGAPAQRRPNRTTAPAFFGAADTDKDGSLTREELKNTFAKWYDQWDTDKGNALTEEKFRAGLNAALPQPTFGGGGGPGGFGGGRGGGGGSGASYASVIGIDLDGQHQYVQFTAKGLVGVAAADGKFLWRYDHPANGMGINCSTPLYHDGLVFAASAYGAGGGAAKLTKEANGGVKAEEVWFSRKMQNHHGGMIVLDGSLYGANGGNEGGFLACLDFKTGNVLWDARELPNRPAPKGSLALADARLYYRTEKGTVLLIEPSPKGYLERGRFEQPDRTNLPAWAHPVVANGKLYIRDQDLLLCYDVKVK